MAQATGAHGERTPPPGGGSVRLELTVPAERPSRVVVGQGLAAPERADLVIADGRVLELHRARLGAAGELPCLALVGAETSKSFAVLERLLDGCAAAGLDRASRILAFGGGVTTDLAGLTAALYMRGIAWTAMPTSLLAQVDASVGGKTAVNLAAGKNLAGAFHPPAEVLVDTEVLATLPPLELRAGLGEVLKAAVLGARCEPGAADAGQPLLELLEATPAEALLAADPGLYAEVVAACVRHKADVVAADLFEAGPRKALNLGHTFAHAIEHTAGFGRIPHGVAVAAGLHLALAAAARVGLLADSQLAGRLDRLALGLGLPGAADPLADLERDFGLGLDRAARLAARAKDQKSRAGAARFVLPLSLGATELDVELEPSLVAGLLGA
ncbi:MAG: 3-dehydroquinate synthase [Planctomycetota bacterium]|nr:3-dehydroquinate synthase [Planctomycetota bacterium]